MHMPNVKERDECKVHQNKAAEVRHECLQSTNLKIYLSLFWFQRREESIVCKTSNMSQKHPAMAECR